MLALPPTPDLQTAKAEMPAGRSACRVKASEGGKVQGVAAGGGGQDGEAGPGHGLLPGPILTVRLRTNSNQRRWRRIGLRALARSSAGRCRRRQTSCRRKASL